MSSTDIQTDRPRLFVSHKQTDAPIAKTLAEFLDEKSGFSLDIHFSSSPEFEGPRIGRNLNAELRKALFRTDALILVYTTEDQDWAYCMWECGLATDPASPDTAIYVFQCGIDVPRPFQDTLRTDASKIDDLRKFVRSFLRDPSFFSNRNKAINANTPDKACDGYAQELYDLLEPQLIKYRERKPEEMWRTWPFVRIEFKSVAIDEAIQLAESDRESAVNHLLENGIVTQYHPRTPLIFGKDRFPSVLSTKSLAQNTGRPSTDNEWLLSSLEQTLSGSQ